VWSSFPSHYNSIVNRQGREPDNVVNLGGRRLKNEKYCISVWPEISNISKSVSQADNQLHSIIQ
jgi:hypothetical protein